MQVLSTNLRSRFAVVSEALRGKDKKIEGKEASEKYYEVIDMGNFQDAMEDREEK